MNTIIPRQATTDFSLKSEGAQEGAANASPPSLECDLAINNGSGVGGVSEAAAEWARSSEGDFFGEGLILGFGEGGDRGGASVAFILPTAREIKNRFLGLSAFSQPGGLHSQI